MCARGRALSEPRLSPDGTVVAFLARDANGTRLLTVPAAGGPELVVTTDPPPAFRGGVFDWAPDGRTIVYATPWGDICRIPSTGGLVEALMPDAAAAALSVSPDGTRVAYAADELARIKVLDLATGAAATVADEADFCLDPVWSPDGTRLAWHEWDVPNMPWDESRIVVADLASGARRVIAFPGAAVQQPRFSPDGTALAFLCDEGGWLTLWVADPDPRPLLDEAYEHGGPTWGPGQSTYAWLPDGDLVVTRNEHGFGRLVRVSDQAELGKGVHSALSARGTTVACIRSGARTPTAVTVYDDGRRTAVARGPVGGFEALDLPEPEAVTVSGVHGRLYAPGPDKPLLVWLHGGPTDQRRVEFDARLAYFLDRGWAVLFPDYRGSTGWGRAYAQALRGEWGRADAEDVAAMLAASDRWDAGRMAVMGGSAGGLTVLRLLADHPGLFRAAVALYPVCDLAELAATTHRYEAHYTQHLVGSPAEHVARSPLTYASRITDPLLLLHGTDDVVVPAAHTRTLAAAVAGYVEHHEYEGEGHGWSKPATTEDELTRVSAFFDRFVLG